MILSVHPLSEYAIGELPPDISLAEENPFSKLRRDVNVQLTYLIELEPFNPEKTKSVTGSPISTISLSSLPNFNRIGATENIYLSDRGYYTEPGCEPPNTSYLPVVNNAFQFDASILNGQEFRGGLPSFGAIKVKNGDGQFDDLTDYFWSNRDITIYSGTQSFSRADFEIIFNGKIQSIEYNEEDITLNVSDKSTVLEQSFVQEVYLGSGGLEGGDDIEGDVKPLCYGEVNNVPLKLVDAGQNIYQAHDGSIENVLAVYDRGVVLNNDGDVADITTASVSGGDYKTQLSGGYIKVGGNPDGTITADVKGDNTNGYVDKVGAIVSRLVKTKMGQNNFGANDVAQGDLNALDDSFAVSTGIYIDGKTQLNEVLNQLTIPRNFYWIFNRQGALSIKAVDEPAVPLLTITKDQIIDDTFEQVEAIDPAWRVSVGYNKNWTVQSLDDLAPGSSTSQKTFAIEEYRKIITEDRATRGRTLIEKEVGFDTNILSESDAENYLDRLIRIYQEKRNIYRLKTYNLLYKVFIGDTITIKYDRFGLDDGKDFVIVGIAEDAEDNETELEVWG